MSLISDYHGRETRSGAVGLHQTSVYIGTIAGGYFAGLIGQHYGWRMSFVVFGGLGMVLGVVLRRFLNEPKRGATETGPAEASLPPMAALRIIFRTPTVRCLSAAFLVVD